MIFDRIAAATSWVEGRAVVVALHQMYVDALAWTGPLARPLRAALGDLESTVQALLKPLGWLTVGAVIYGRTLPGSDRAASALSAAEREAILSRVDQRRRIRRAYGRVSSERSWLGRVWRAISRQITSRFSFLTDGLRVLRAAGWARVLSFCVLFLAVLQLDEWLEWLIWGGLGPLEVSDVAMLRPWVGAGVTSIHVALVLSLVAASLDSIVRRQSTENAQPQLTGTAG